MTIPTRATLTITAGTVVKAESEEGLEVQGALVADGTASSPVTFTSVNDNSVGGVTGSGSPSPGDWGRIQSFVGASVSLVHAVVEYSRFGVLSDGASSVVVDDSRFAHESELSVSLETSGSVSPQVIEAAGNTLELGGQASGIEVYSFAGEAPTVTGNTVTGALGFPVNIRGSNLAPAKLTGNTGSGNKYEGVVLSGTLGGNLTLPLGGLPLVVGYNSLTISSGVTMTVPAGTVVKAESEEGLEVQGALVADGTASSPVTFTSVNDNSVGGVTGSGSPSPGDWGGITVAREGTAELIGTTLKYASAALSVAGDAEATIHGSILDSTVGVSSNSYVDATSVNWGSPSGPAPIGTGTAIQGAGVQPAPWVGEPSPTLPSPPVVPPPTTGSCAAVIFIGARGSGEHEKEPAAAYSDPERMIGPKVLEIYEGFAQELTRLAGLYDERPPTHAVVAVAYPALGISLGDIWHFFGAEYLLNLWEGVWAVEDTLIDEEARCPSAKFVLAGYSSGAFAVHEALSELNGQSSISTSRVAAAVLLADPAKEPDGAEYKVGTAKSTAIGIYPLVIGAWSALTTDPAPSALLSGPIPSSLTSRTISLCNNHDIVCAPGRGADSTVHGAYQGAELEELGDFAAEELLTGH